LIGAFCLDWIGNDLSWTANEILVSPQELGGFVPVPSFFLDDHIFYDVSMFQSLLLVKCKPVTEKLFIVFYHLICEKVSEGTYLMELWCDDRFDFGLAYSGQIVQCALQMHQSCRQKPKAQLG